MPRNKFEKGNKIWLGRKHTQEQKDKIRKAHLGMKKPWASRSNKIRKVTWGRKISQKLKGKTTWNKGKVLPKGKLANHWQGGKTLLQSLIRNSFKYRQWRSDVFTKDKFTCRNCGDKRGGNLEAHHYPKSFSKILREYQIKTLEQALNCEELWNINNGITLCEKCHGNVKKLGIY